MIPDKEITEYRILCNALMELHVKYQKKKLELRQLLKETAALRSDALLVLAKANRLTRHLNSRQRQICGLNYSLAEINARINQDISAPLKGRAYLEEREIMPEIPPGEDFRNLRELRQKGLLIIGLIDNIREKLLKLELLELYCRELILSINKSMFAFRHEWKIIRRRIYPFGIFSLCYRFLRSIFGKSYFSLSDLNDIAALGNITGLVFKIADSPQTLVRGLKSAYYSTLNIGSIYDGEKNLQSH